MKDVAKAESRKELEKVEAWLHEEQRQVEENSQLHHFLNCITDSGI
jgi:hypothetical protein